MTSPPKEIDVDCPQCGLRYKDWHRASIDLGLDDFDDDYLERASTVTCPECDFTMSVDQLRVDDSAFDWHEGGAHTVPDWTRWRCEPREYIEPPLSRDMAFWFAENILAGAGELPLGARRRGRRSMLVTKVISGELLDRLPAFDRLRERPDECWVVLARRPNSPQPPRPAFIFSKFSGILQYECLYKGGTPTFMADVPAHTVSDVEPRGESEETSAGSAETKRR